MFFFKENTVMFLVDFNVLAGKLQLILQLTLSWYFLYLKSKDLYLLWLN